MKKQMIVAALTLGAFVFGTKNVQAQTGNVTTKVNITLSDVISIEDGSAANNGEVNFNYATADDYNSTQTKTIDNSLIVTSTTSFDVKVKAGGNDFTDGSNTIPVNVLTLKPVTASSSAMGGTQNDIVLSASDQTLIGGADLGSELILDMEYVIPEAKSSSSDILGKPAGTYTQNVIYTATAL